MAATAPNQPYVDDAYKASALLRGLKEDDVETIKAYAALLERNNLPVIFDDKHLALILGYQTGLLYSISNAPSHFYRVFEIPKKAGGKRKIREPLPSLKEIQRILLGTIVSKIRISKAAKAFRRDANTKENARLHLRQKAILRLDLLDFFPSVKSDQVNRLFFELGYTKANSQAFSRSMLL